MRLALIRQRYTPYGGAERFVEGALEALLERNVAISLYTRSWPETKLQLIEPVICNPRYIGRLWRDWGFARRVCKELPDADADLVQSHERLLCCDVYRAGDGVHAVWLEQRARVASPAARLASHVSPYHRYVLAMERRLFGSPWLRAVICNSRMVRDEIRERFGVPEARLPVIHNAVDSQGFHPGLRSFRSWTRERHGIPESAVVYLLVGSGYQRKGVASAIAALAQLPANAHLLVVGRDRQPKRYARLARRLGVAGRVTFAGAQSEPKPYYGAADAFVLPTLYDPCPNAALEAMACGLPIVTSTKSGAGEIVLEHGAGLVCDSLDVRALADHMLRLYDPETRQGMGAKAREAALALTPAAMTLKLVLLYRELLAGAVQIREAQAATTQGGGTTTRRAPTTTRAPSTPAAAQPPEVMGAAGVADAAAELPRASPADLPEPPVLQEPASLDGDVPPEILDGLAGRDPRAG